MAKSYTVEGSPWRVEIPCYLDTWMRGARFGTVVREYLDKEGRNLVAVKMDHPQIRKLVRCLANDCKFI